LSRAHGGWQTGKSFLVIVFSSSGNEQFLILAKKAVDSMMSEERSTGALASN